MKAAEYLKRLISFPTVSTVSNADISHWVSEQLQQLGFQTEWHEYTDPSGAIKVCVSGRKGPSSGRGLAYFCHTDVVSVETWSHPESGPWEPSESEGRLYGRGSCDMKGSLACMLAAAASVAGEDLKEPLAIVCTADEEIGLKGAQAIVADSPFYRDLVQRQSRAVVGEPTLLQVVHAHKGGRGLKFTARGVAAHSSTGKGVNANYQMIPFLAEIYELNRTVSDDKEWQDDRYDPPTINMNVGINDHTSAVNITPAQSVCTVNFRAMPAIDADGLANRIKDAGARYGLELEVMFETEPLFSDPDSAFVQEMLALTQTEASHTVPYGTDGSCFQELNDIVVCGPGDIRQAHRDDEWISLEQLDLGTELYAKLIRHWCCGGSADVADVAIA